MTKRLCKLCNKEFPATPEFFYTTLNKKNNKTYLRSACRSCHSTAVVEVAKERRKREPDLVRTNERKVRQDILEWVNSLKASPCTDCGNTYPPVCMDFDHLPNQEKSIDVSTARARKWSKERLLKEVAKCELVCSNCHRIRTQNRQKTFANSVREEVDLYEELRDKVLSTPSTIQGSEDE